MVSPTCLAVTLPEITFSWLIDDERNSVLVAIDCLRRVAFLVVENAFLVSAVKDLRRASGSIGNG